MDVPDDAAGMAAAAARADEGDRLRKQSQVADAEAAYRAAIALDPLLPRAHSGLGRVLREASRYAEAEAACREAIRLDPGYAPAHGVLGLVLRDTKRLAEAETACQEAIRLDPALAAAHNYLGIVLLDTKRYAEAEAALREAIRLDPAVPEAHADLGIVQYQTQRYTDAEAAFREAIRLDPALATAHHCLGLALYQTKRYAEAEAAFREAIRLDPALATAHLILGRIMRQTKRYAEADAAFSEAVRLDPAHVDFDTYLRVRRSAWLKALGITRHPHRIWSVERHWPDSVRADAGDPPGRGGQQRVVRLALAGMGVLVLLAGGITWGVVASRPARPAWQPGYIYNLVLVAGPAVVADGNDYPQIATRAEDPAPLATGELATVVPSKNRGPLQVSADCAGAVTGQAVVRALRAAGCTQVLRLIAISTGTGGPYTGLIDIFNLASGAAAYQAARAFGEESPNAGQDQLEPPNAAPGGFILPWRGTAAAGVARAPGNAADVNAFGHFLVVLWTYGSGGGPFADDGPQLSNGLFELVVGQFAQNRVNRQSAG